MSHFMRNIGLRADEFRCILGIEQPRDDTVNPMTPAIMIEETGLSKPGQIG